MADGFEVYDDRGRYLGGEQPLSDWWEANRLKASVADREAAVAARFDLQPLLNRGANLLVNAAGFDDASRRCREVAASFGWGISAIHHFGGGEKLLPLTHLVRCRTTTEPVVDVEFRLPDSRRREIDWVEIQAFIVLEGTPEPLLEKLTTIVKDARQALEASK